jgi:predicted dehydrogenase
MNRRDFTRLGTLTAATMGLKGAMAQGGGAAGATPVAPPVAVSNGMKPLGFAAVGIGGISTAFMDSVAGPQNPSPNIKLTGLVTGHPDTKGVQFSAMYNIPKTSVYTYETFDQVAKNKDIDVLYIGLPNSMHCEYTVRGAEAGKHILCEKPMAISSAECQTMIDACKSANVKLMIAYRMQYDPMWQAAQEIVQAGTLGRIQSLRGNMLQSQVMGWRQTKQYGGGGPMMDLGIYPLNGIRFLTGEEPAEFTAVTATRDKDDPRFKEMEQSIEWTMKFPSGIITSCGCSYGQFGLQTVMVSGDKGFITLTPAFGGGGIRLWGSAGTYHVDQVGTGRGHFQLAIEGEHMVDCIRKNKQPKTPGEEGKKDLLAIEAVYRAAGTPIA